MNTLLARLDDLEQAFADMCREARGLIQAADVRAQLLEARLDELRSVHRVAPLAPPVVEVAQPINAALPSEPPVAIAKAKKAKKEHEFACITCGKTIVSTSVRRKFCGDCFRAAASARMSKMQQSRQQVRRQTSRVDQRLLEQAESIDRAIAIGRDAVVT
jgi:hypothetical protein